MTEDTPAPEIYLGIRDQRKGPFTREQVQEMLRVGEVNLDTLSWKKGMADWIPLHRLLDGASAPPLPTAASSEFVVRIPKQAVTGFFARLFDFRLVHFITPGLLRMAYVFHVVVGGLLALFYLVISISGLAEYARRSSEMSGVLVWIIGLPIIIIVIAILALIYLIYGRIFVELIAVFFRLHDKIASIESIAVAASAPSPKTST